jgi:pyruvate formate-lyase activating enzyme-like uncharacterized protein
MEAYYYWLNSLVNNNKVEFAKWPLINWLNPYESVDYQTIRDNLLKEIGTSTLFKDTKPYYNQISKGCSICGSGKWSCLFITNKCNATCFYCPASQLQDERPSTQGLDFDDPIAYAEYVKDFAFEGVSFSGGEPLLFFDRTLDYLKAVRKICNKEVYIWMYTNGILADTEKLKKLAQHGLNEIRFDIGATGFSIDKVKLATGLIPNITIEIPAVPEELDTIKNLLPELVKAGVTNMNLHQMRLTPHNADKLIKRGYTIINAERPLVLESELTALEIINYARENSIEIGINYCSFHFKNRFQKAGYRNTIAKILAPYAHVTPNGYIRENTGDTLTYKTLKLSLSKSELTNSSHLQSNLNNYNFNEKIVLRESHISTDQQSKIKLLTTHEPLCAPNDPLLFKIWQLEYIEKGLRDY